MANKKKDIAGTLADVEELSTEDKLREILSGLERGLAPKRKIDLDEWSDRYRFLPSETSAEHGQWRTSRFPFLRRIMKCLSPSSRATTIVAIKGCQLGFTEVCINWILYIADVMQGGTLYCQKTKDAAEDFASQKLEPNIKLCEKVKDTLGVDKPKYLKNETTSKGFPGGFIDMGGANSGAFLRSKSVPWAMADEEDSYKANIDGEGSPIGMIEKRQVNFPFSKMFRLSTPKFTETSTIEPAFLAGSQEYFYVPCPECNPKARETGTMFVINQKNIQWDDKTINSEGYPKEVWLVCESCGAMIQEHKKTWMLENGDWFSEKGSPGVRYKVGDVLKPSFHLSSFYSPLGFYSWMDFAYEKIRYLKTRDPALLQVIVNQTYGETFSLAGQEISSNWLYERREKYKAQVPKGVLYLTCGVDCQQDRLELEIVGWGLNNESYSIAYLVLEGNTEYLPDSRGLAPDGKQSVWSKLDEYLYAKYQHELGFEMEIGCCAIDASFRTDVVNTYCKYREADGVYPIQGRDGWKKGIIERPKRRHEEYKTIQYTFWVDELKSKCHAYLKVAQPGPGYCHFPENDQYTQKYFKGLTCEYLRVEKGTLKWINPPGARNEPTDCRAYARGALAIAAPNLEYRAQHVFNDPEAEPREEPENKLPLESAAQNNPSMVKQGKEAPRRRKFRRKIKSNGVW